MPAAASIACVAFQGSSPPWSPKPRGDCSKTTNALYSLLTDVCAFLGVDCPSKEQVRHTLEAAHPAFNPLKVLERGLTKLTQRELGAKTVCENIVMKARQMLQVELPQAVSFHFAFQ